ncbi:MAG: hypothetical protein ACRERS_08300 [Methylococcales bacterium]
MYFIRAIGKYGQSGSSEVNQSILGQAPGAVRVQSLRDELNHQPKPEAAINAPCVKHRCNGGFPVSEAWAFATIRLSFWLGLAKLRLS